MQLISKRSELSFCCRGFLKFLLNIKPVLIMVALFGLNASANLYASTVTLSEKSKSILDKVSDPLTEKSKSRAIITGVIKDENGQPIPGVTIKVKGQDIAVVSDVNGKFKINAAIGQTLVVSFLGFQQKEVVITNNSLLEIKLVDSFTSLNEVVVLGYGSSKRVDLSSSSSTIGAKVFEDMPVATFDMALQGRAAGVQVTSSSGEPGGGVSIIIRGNNSVSASNQPLYVVDGFPISPGEEARGNSNNGLGQQGAPSNPLAFINPNDIESVEVLKDAAATAIYGSRGANGVVLVTTKKGKIGKGVLNLSYDTGIRRLTNFPEMMTGQEFAELWNETFIGSPFRGYLRPNPSNTRDRNWADEVLRDGVTQNALLSLSGGTKENTYNIAGGYYKELGTMKTSKYERATLRLRASNQIAPRLNVTTLFNGSRIGNRRTSNGSGAVIGGDAILDVLRAKPVSDDFTDEEFINDDIVSNAYNPVNSLNRKDFTINTDFLISSQVKYNIAKGLDLNINPGVSFRESQRNIFFPSTEALGARTNGFASIATLNSQNYVIENFLTYVKTIKKKHNINLVAGFSGQQTRSLSNNATAQNFLNNSLGSDNISLALIQNPPTTDKRKTDLQSLFFRSNFSFFNSKFLASYTIRRDGYSAFAKNNKFAIFQAGSIGWNIFKEDFLKDSKVISNFKLRASYGTSGTTSIGPYQSLFLQGSQNGVVNNRIIGGIGPINVGNPDLKWETTKQADIGLDFGAFNEKLTITVDVYRKNTVDLLQRFPLPGSSGYASYLTNVGTIRNQGIEIDIAGTPLKKKDFSWNTSFNISFQRSKVLNLGGATINGVRVGGNFFGPLNRIVEGDAYATFYGYRVLGLQQYDHYNPVTGLWKYPGENAQAVGSLIIDDANKDGVINDLDIVKIGNPNPDYTFGFNNDFSYKKLTLSVFFQGSIGNDIFNATGMLINSGSVNSFGNQTKEWWLNRWTPFNQHNDIRYPSYTTNANTMNNTRGVEDGSYVRLKNVRLAYNLPAKLLSSIKIRSLSAYATLNNIITWTKYTGFDPEVNSGTAAGSTNNNIGSDIGSYPRSNTLLLGLRVGL